MTLDCALKKLIRRDSSGSELDRKMDLSLDSPLNYKIIRRDSNKV